MKPSNVLDKIRATGAKPIPAWRFALSRWAVRGALVVALAAAGAAGALSLREAWEPGADFMTGRMRHMPSPWELRAMPLAWLAVAAAALASALAVFRRLPTGHRWRLPALAAVLLTCVALLGTLLGAVGGPRMVDQVLRATVPGFSAWSDEQRMRFFREVWMRPGEGVVAGVVEEILEDGFVLRGLDGSRWQVAHSGSLQGMSGSGASVRVFGEISGSGSFSAKEVRPMMRRGEGFRRDDAPFPMGGPRGGKFRPGCLPSATGAVAATGSADCVRPPVRDWTGQGFRRGAPGVRPGGFGSGVPLPPPPVPAP